MNIDDDEAAIWERARRDDGDAFASLFDRHRSRVFNRALSLLSNQHDAEDVAAAAFFELWRKRRSVVPVEGSVLPWLLVSTLNLARNHRRSALRYQHVLRSLPRDDDKEDPDVELTDARQRLGLSLRDLPPVDAALFVLTVLEGMSTEAAAKVVGLNAPAARKRLHRARLRLQVELSDLKPAFRPAIERN